MTDKELLELAAKAVEKDIDPHRYDPDDGFAIRHIWNQKPSPNLRRRDRQAKESGGAGMKPTTDDVLKWAREADLPACHTTHPKALIRFAALAYAAGAAAMKERCAKVCDAQADKDGWEGCYADECAAAIRALGDDDE